MPELLIGRLAQQVAGLDLERLGELADDVETNGVRVVGVFGTAHGVPMQARALGQLALQQRPPGTPVTQSRDWHHGRTRRHCPNGSRRPQRGCFRVALASVDGRHGAIVAYLQPARKPLVSDNMAENRTGEHAFA